MIGNDLYKIDVNFELSSERLKSLVLFYSPLIGQDGLALYEYLVIRGSNVGFEEVNDLLGQLNISVDLFEKVCGKLNQYRLLRTLNKENHYVFLLKAPLTMKEFIKDDIFVRNFILKTSGSHYQDVISDVYEDSDYHDFKDVSKTLPLDTLIMWNENDETYLKQRKTNKYDFGTRFDVNVFLKDISLNLLPMRFRTEENMREVAKLADLYNISYDKMQTYLPRVAQTDSDNFNLEELRKLCMYAKQDYHKIGEDEYDVPCVTYLMALQNGKEATYNDKKIIYYLSNYYNLNVPVINVLLAHGLKNAGNRLIENYLYPIASDLHRNDIKTSKEALEFLNNNTKKSTASSDKLPSYDTSNNKTISNDEEDEILKLMGKR